MSFLTTTNQMVAGYHDLYWADRDVTSSPTFLALGSTGPEGIRVNQELSVAPITGDALGDTELDGIFRGQNLTIDFVLQEINDDVVRDFLAWFRETAVTVANTPYHGELGQVGEFICNLAGTLEARPRIGTAANTANGGNSTRRYVGVNIGPIQETLDTNPNFIPCRFKAYPFDDSGTTRIFGWEASPAS